MLIGSVVRVSNAEVLILLVALGILVVIELAVLFLAYLIISYLVEFYRTHTATPGRTALTLKISGFALPIVWASAGELYVEKVIGWGTFINGITTPLFIFTGIIAWIALSQPRKVASVPPPSRPKVAWNTNIPTGKKP